MSLNFKDFERTSPHLAADVIELSLFYKSRGKSRFFRGDLESFWKNSDYDMEEIDAELHEPEVDDERSSNQSSAELNARQEKQVEDLLAHFSARALQLNHFYPFKVGEDSSITVVESPSEHQRIYLFLLACSRLHMFSMRSRQKWATYFVNLCKTALSGLLPAAATVHVFDAHSEDRQKIYGNKLSEALQVLAKHLSAHPTQECQKLDEQNTGDAGIDLVGYLDFADSAKHNHVILAQCAARQESWIGKTLECHPIRVRHYLDFTFDYPSATFVPVHYRNDSGEWVDNKDTAGCLLLDRCRILRLVCPQSAEIVAQPWFQEFEVSLQSEKPD